MTQSGFARIRSMREQLTGSDEKLANYIIENATITRSMTIQALAQSTKLSTATVSRFVKRIGYSSFREFSLSLAIATPTEATFFGEIDENDNPEAIVKKVFSGAQNALTATSDLLKPADMIQATDWLINARRVGLFGIGGSSIVAFNGYHKLLRTPLDVEQHPDYDVQLMQAVRMKSSDVAIIISHSGRNSDTLKIAEQLKENGVKIIAITAYPQADLAKHADLVLASAAEEVNIRSESMSSLIAQITIVDSLFTLVGVRLGAKTQQIVDDMRVAIESTRE
ncbi:MurR/RpiR family transcriptional regulator [Weissella soli]|jgi:RpiR family carbohydrate utilization transcriptional regulator|uniref:RpiR family transcriptional regulator n=1 Tax=Weissella soli TaxID=155866 RepID=A0A288QXZ8_9LACO|nr:MurR/RpiR family transcriptional regulator [Weissella soli]AOT57033.1 putative HTH-type transcriptional regulator [Weissella soli]NKY83484.1 MurR/RpiR family transcriptional regulator [Weissella soli]RDL05225.1 RpiR family transcriptional regulator [Weissella soli]GEN93940.1 RpiR family transcriptional regulator [Weissella soli]